MAKTAKTRWEHRKHTYEPGGKQADTEADYFIGECPACEIENTLLCVVGGTVHMQRNGPCAGCGATLPYDKAIEKAIVEGPPQVIEKVEVKVEVPKEAPPGPDADVIDVAKLVQQAPPDAA